MCVWCAGLLYVHVWHSVPVVWYDVHVVYVGCVSYVCVCVCGMQGVMCVHVWHGVCTCGLV